MANLMRYEDASVIRTATPEELKASEDAAKRDGGVGAITVDGVTCYVTADVNTTAAVAEIRIWDECASDSFFVDADGNVYDKDGKKSKRRTSDWGHLIDDDGANDAAAITEIIADWSDGYDGDTSNIRAEITRL